MPRELTRRAPSQGNIVKLVNSTDSTKLEEMKQAELAKTMARHDIRVASTRNVRNARLAEKEDANDDAAKEKCELECEAARCILASEEAKSELAVKEVTEKWNTMIEQRKEIEVCDHSRTVCAARTCSPRHLVSQIKRQLRVEKCEAEQATAKKRKADQQEAAQVAVQREDAREGFQARAYHRDVGRDRRGASSACPDPRPAPPRPAPPRAHTRPPPCTRTRRR